MPTEPPKLELPLTLRLSADAKRWLETRAEASGTDLAGYVSALLEQMTHRPMTLEEISGPIAERFRESGMSDDELAELLEAEKHAARAQRRARRAS